LPQRETEERISRVKVHSAGVSAFLADENRIIVPSYMGIAFVLDGINLISETASVDFLESAFCLSAGESAKHNLG
jgi:hypothetical protein